MVKGDEFRSNLMDVFARLSKNEVGRVKIIPIRKMTFKRGLEALTILQSIKNNVSILNSEVEHKNYLLFLKVMLNTSSAVATNSPAVTSRPIRAISNVVIVM